MHCRMHYQMALRGKPTAGNTCTKITAVFALNKYFKRLQVHRKSCFVANYFIDCNFGDPQPATLLRLSWRWMTLTPTNKKIEPA